MKPTREEIADVIKDLLLSGYTVGIGMEPIIAKHLEKALDKGWREGSFEHLKGLTKEETELESKLITYFGCYNECLAIQKKHFNGTKGGMLINADIGKRPYWVQSVLNNQFGIIKYVQ